MRKSGYLQRMEKAKELELLNTLRFTRQIVTDCSLIALNSAFGFGPDRLRKFCDEMLRVYEEYANVWNEDSKDTEYARELLDRKLSQICGEYFQPWEERYG